jgi:preprotein translocase subunit SecD
VICVAAMRDLVGLVSIALLACGSSGGGAGSNGGAGLAPGEPGASKSGRTEIVYELDRDLVVLDRAEVVQRDIEAMLADRKILGAVRVSYDRPGALVVLLPDPARSAEVADAMRSTYADQLEARDCEPGDPPGAICRHIGSAYAETMRKAALDGAVNIVRQRLDAMRARSPSVLPQGNTIVVELDTDALAGTALFERAGKLELKVVDHDAKFSQYLFAHVGYERGGATDPDAIAAGITMEIDAWVPDGSSERHADYFAIARDREVHLPITEARALGCTQPPPAGATTVLCRVRGRDVIRRYLEKLAASDPRFVLPSDRQIGYELVTPAPTAKDPRPFWRSYYLERRAQLTGTSISKAEKVYDPTTGRPLVLLDFNRRGAMVFGELTSHIAGKKLAILLDGIVMSAPIINEPIRGGRASIAMGGTDPDAQEREARDLVTTLTTGALPAPLREVSRRSW